MLSRNGCRNLPCLPAGNEVDLLLQVTWWDIKLDPVWITATKIKFWPRHPGAVPYFPATPIHQSLWKLAHSRLRVQRSTRQQRKHISRIYIHLLWTNVRLSVVISSLCHSCGSVQVYRFGWRNLDKQFHSNDIWVKLVWCVKRNVFTVKSWFLCFLSNAHRRRVQILSPTPCVRPPAPDFLSSCSSNTAPFLCFTPAAFQTLYQIIVLYDKAGLWIISPGNPHSPVNIHLSPNADYSPGYSSYQMTPIWPVLSLVDCQTSDLFVTQIFWERIMVLRRHPNMLYVENKLTCGNMISRHLCCPSTWN